MSREHQRIGGEPLAGCTAVRVALNFLLFGVYFLCIRQSGRDSHWRSRGGKPAVDARQNFQQSPQRQGTFCRERERSVVGIGTDDTHLRPQATHAFSLLLLFPTSYFGSCLLKNRSSRVPGLLGVVLPTQQFGLRLWTSLYVRGGFQFFSRFFVFSTIDGHMGGKGASWRQYGLKTTINVTTIRTKGKINTPALNFTRPWMIAR